MADNKTLEELIVQDIEGTIDTEQLTSEEKTFLDEFKHLKGRLNDIFDYHLPTKTTDIERYVENAITKLGKVLNSKVNYWIDTGKATHKRRSTDKISHGQERGIKKRYRLKCYSTQSPDIRSDFVDSRIFDEAIEKDVPFIGEGENLRNGELSKSYIIQPTRIKSTNAIIAISGKKPDKATTTADYTPADLYAIRHFNMRLERKRSEERRVGKECRSRWSPYH